ncbi:hypothetical protein [Salinimicrobium oceani]|uniref:Hemerythrin HHE cation binding domain-containing protein n=1 Tax=Salinimicrobium oceani TaxID=2722702 RepID=A0ABX1CXY0_9FLAO|nr:hypothetical protein [Salinimicrobium oceani]NJW51804.1 hypothetical protein [Salinimicrobium oceani]
MKEHVQEHHNDLELIRLEMIPECERWLEKTDFINREINFFRMLLFHNFMAKINPNVEASKMLLKQLDDLQDTNTSHLKAIRQFRNKLEGLRECDDVACENLYLGEYLNFKETLYEHLEDVQKVKSLLYNYFGKGLEK